MNALRPSPQQERWMATAARLHLAADLRFIADRTGGWTAPSSIARGAFFVLGAVAAALTVAIFEFLHLRGALFASGVVMLLVAEWLMLRSHLFHAGVEEALWTCGLLAVVLQLIQTTSVDLEPRIALMIALAFAVAGFRLLNPLFVTLAAVAASVAIDLGYGHRPFGAPGIQVQASVFCYAIGAVAFFAGRIEFRRPGHDQMLNWLMVLMPLCGFLWLETDPAVRVRTFTGVASAVFGVAALLAGLRRRAHAPLIAALLCFGCVAYQLRDLTALPLEVKLIICGGAALLLALGLERYLRTPRRGITSLQIVEGSRALDLLQLAGAAALMPKSSQPDSGADQFKGGGGTFGGGGADGSY